MECGDTTTSIAGDQYIKHKVRTYLFEQMHCFKTLVISKITIINSDKIIFYICLLDFLSKMLY